MSTSGRAGAEQINEDWPFGDLQPHSFGLILADPPWRFVTHSERGQKKAAPYRTMSKSELMRLPVHRLAAPHCALCMWSTREQLDFAIELMRRWGFDYKTMGAWGKLSKNSTPGADDAKKAFGKGHWWRDACEPFIFGTIGQPKNHSHRERSWIDGPVQEHSRKPVELHEQLERMLPRVRRLEMFSRCERPGWTHWGDQVGLFAPEDSA